MNLKDNSNKIIASSNFSNFDASFSSSGNEVIYVKQTSVDPMSTRNDIILVNLNNFVETNLTINNAIEGVYPKISPDGNMVCFSGYRNELDRYNIYILDRNGTNMKQLTNDSLKYLNSVFSLDGTQIFCTGFNGYGNEIYSLNISNKTITNLTKTNFEYIYDELSLSPNNKTLLFTRHMDPYSSDIFLIDIDGSNFRQLTYSNSSLNGKFSYNGEKILFIDKVNEVFQIFEMKIDGSDKVNLSNDNSNNTLPIFLP
jgi:Tol biopolymer transport system component